MQPIHELLSRIRWDEEFASNEFRIAYYDRIEDRLIQIPFHALYFDEQDHFAFQVVDQEGETHHIPYHRVKELYKNGELIWHRSH